jgi:phospholipid-binding lipoprotein MlaA
VTRRTRSAFVALALATSLPLEARAQVPVQSETPVSIPSQSASTHTQGDPLEHFNRRMFALNQTIDRAVFRPLALTLGKVVPKPVWSGGRNFLHNLAEPLVFLNDILQLKPKRALRTFTRFVLNSTIGIGGLVDVAKSAQLPHVNNSFGSTLARYGVGPGPYLFLPFVGPATLRDLPVDSLGQAVYPVAIGKPFNRLDWQLGTGAFLGIDKRITSDRDLRTLLSGAADPYATLRSVFLQNRAAEVAEIKGKPAGPAVFDDPLDDPGNPLPETKAPDMPAPGQAPPPDTVQPAAEPDDAASAPEDKTEDAPEPAELVPSAL